MAVKPNNAFTSPMSVSQAVSHLVDVGDLSDDENTHTNALAKKDSSWHA